MYFKMVKLLIEQINPVLEKIDDQAEINHTFLSPPKCQIVQARSSAFLFKAVSSNKLE